MSPLLFDLKTTFIYALKEPDTGEIRCIGKATNLGKRFRKHINTAYNKKTHKECWIFSLLSRALKPELEVLDEVPYEHWQQWEVAYIEFFREQGCDLTNSTSGGEGAAPSDETRRKMSAARLGKKASTETCQKLSAALLGNKRGIGRETSPGTREKISAAGLGRIVAVETRRKISVAHTGKQLTPEHRTKISVAKSGQKPSFETRIRLSVSQKARREREKQEREKTL